MSDSGPPFPDKTCAAASQGRAQAARGPSVFFSCATRGAPPYILCDMCLLRAAAFFCLTNCPSLRRSFWQGLPCWR
jgi:hypothetical protein